MARSKAKQEILNVRNASYEVAEHRICMTCKHWWNGAGYSIRGTCQPSHLGYRDRCDHFKETPANGTCDIWEAKEQS